MIEDLSKIDRHGNTIAREGVDVCSCGCKYWHDDRCIDCDAHVSQASA
jgi:hypothetical protein